jgi:hypothetical protein
MRGDVQDGTGDTATDRRLAVAPDLVSGSIEVLSDGRVRFRARFAPGTYARETTKVQFNMDTDENSSTGETLPGVIDIGVDYIVVVGSSYYGAVGHLRKVEIGGFVLCRCHGRCNIHLGWYRPDLARSGRKRAHGVSHLHFFPG